MMKFTAGILLLCLLGLAQSRTVRELNSAVQPSDKRVVCYYTNWASYRQLHKFTVDDINPHLCTHLLYAYAGLEKSGNFSPFDLYQDIQLEGYSKFVNLKKENPDLKVYLSVGGSKQGSFKFSKIASNPELRSFMAKNSLEFIKKYGFDGLDIVWKYPNSAENPSAADKENFVKLIKEIRNEFKDNYGISIVVPPLESLLKRGIDLPQLSKYVDFMTVLTYDYHKSTDPTLGHIAPLYPIAKDTFKDLNMDATFNAYLGRGADPAKLNMAVALYGITFILENPEQTNFGDLAEDEGDGTQERGTVLYNQFCSKIKEESWTIKHVNKSAVGPYAYNNIKWIAYDDEDMIRTKARYAVEKKLGGMTFWSIDMDDFKGNICQTDGTVKYPLIKAAREELFA